MIMTCLCNSKYQDAHYGKGHRVHNFAPKALPNGGYRCTVCERVKSKGNKTT